MNINSFKKFLNDCKNFVDKMNGENISKREQQVLLRQYISIYNIENDIRIRPTKYNITEFVS